MSIFEHYLQQDLHRTQFLKWHMSWLTGNKESRKHVPITDTDRDSYSPVFPTLLGPGTT